MGLQIIAIKLKKPPERDIKEVISIHIKPQLWEQCGRILDLGEIQIEKSSQSTYLGPLHII